VTLERARQLLKVQADFGGPYNANSSKLILSEVITDKIKTENRRDWNRTFMTRCLR
jgi:hypothetical protein